MNNAKAKIKIFLKPDMVILKMSDFFFQKAKHYRSLYINMKLLNSSLLHLQSGIFGPIFSQPP